jgi:UDP-N-acetylmuramoyl-tripeptide--D-alanyl-D-alanine ligase
MTPIPEGHFCIRVENTLNALQSLASLRRSQINLKVIGITGSVGKSTTKELVAEVISQKYRTLKNLGNQNNEIGLPLTLLRLGRSHECAVLEMGFYVPGEITQLCQIAKPQVGIVTNIGTVHAERAGSQEIIARGKAELVQSLPAEGTAILNFDDPWVKAMADQTRSRVISYGLNPAFDLWADEIEGLGMSGIRLRLHYDGVSTSLHVPLIGRHSVHTVLRAAAAGLAEELSWGQIQYGLTHATSQLRLVAVHTRQGALLLDDSYNASPESTLAALNLLGELQGRKIAVLGGMFELGQYEQKGHELVGLRVAEIADRLITFGEHARMIADAAIEAGMPASRIIRFDELNDIVAELQSTLKEDDVVLVKGSHGLRMDRIVSALEEQE